MSQNFIKKLTYWPITAALTLSLSLSTLVGPIALAADDTTAQNTTTSTANTGVTNVSTPPVLPLTDSTIPPAGPTPPTTTTLPSEGVSIAPPAIATDTSPIVATVSLPETPPSPTSSCTPPPATSEVSAQSQQANSQVSQTATINGNYCSIATTGDATVTQNHSAGNATTGNALTAATILNLLQSSGNVGSQLQSLPTINIDGNQKGDITLKLDSLKSSSCDLVCSGLQINKLSDSDSTINNTIVMDANSGNAAVTFNHKAGDASSGDATVSLNLVNIINSLIASSKAFVGTININGSLDGDILLQGATLNNLNNVDSDSFGGSGGYGSTNTAINNNLDLSALTGNADVSNNSKAGNASSGGAKTGVNASNLIGTQVDGKNALLVFVNVMGKWQGMIVNNPDSINALLGDANQCACGASHGSGDTTSSTINNDIKLSAITGNATVANNHKAGNATTGDATANLNLLNIADSSFNLSDWFGILFINVYGSWDGSFGLDTSAGGSSAAASSGGSSSAKIEVTGIINKKTPKAKKVTTISVSSSTTTPTSVLVIPKVQGVAKNTATILKKHSSKYNLKFGVAGGLVSFMLMGAIERRTKGSKKAFVAQTA